MAIHSYIPPGVERNENPVMGLDGFESSQSVSITFFMDCVEGMKCFPDNYFDLAVVDPPYGIGMGKGAGETRGNGKKKKDLYTPKTWDKNKPTDEYWEQLFRVSKNQIVWGGNYFTKYLPESRGWFYWRKLMGGDYSDGELAWTSFDMILKEYTMRSEQGDKRFHPTQKPIQLYDFCLKYCAKPNDLILDTHLGSQSSRIAANKAGLDFVGFEVDRDYFDQGNARFKEFIRQARIF